MTSELAAKHSAECFAVSFIRLLFKNSEEVKRTRFFSEPGSSGYEIALAVMAFVALSAASAAKRDLTLWQLQRRRGAARRINSDSFGAQGYRVK